MGPARTSIGQSIAEDPFPARSVAEAGGAGADALFAKCKNPYYLGDEPALTQTLGWTGGWTTRASDYAVAAETAADVAFAVDFARRNAAATCRQGRRPQLFRQFQ